MTTNTIRVALLWHGDHEARNTATLKESRFRGVSETLMQVGITVEPAVYADEFIDEVKDQLLQVDGVLVWVNPIEKGKDRSVLDIMLKQVANEGVFVSAHPDVILKMGTKEVLYQTRDMSWGCDIYRYAIAQELREQFPLHLTEGNPRVLKQYRGNGGNGVWKIELRSRGLNASETQVCVRHALRGSVEEIMSLNAFFERCDPYFSGSGCIIDQAYQERLIEGMVRCYLIKDKVAGFGHQAINALFPAPLGAPPQEAPQPGPRLYYPPTRPDFQPLKQKLENECVPEMCQILDLDIESLPIIWDADFLYGPKTLTGEDTYVLCEINVSSVYPFPDEALEPLAQETRRRLESALDKTR